MIKRPRRGYCTGCRKPPSAPLGIAVGEGVSEMRIHHGPGFRVYFVRHGAAVYVLLCGGDKSSQRRDIARAKRMARDLKESGR